MVKLSIIAQAGTTGDAIEQFLRVEPDGEHLFLANRSIFIQFEIVMQ